MDKPLLITDASILLNFLYVRRFDLLQNMGYRVRIVDAVYDEVQSERELLDSLVEADEIRVLSISDRMITSTVPALIAAGLGTGEAFSIAAAIDYGGAIAIDDRRAIKRAREKAPELEVVTSIDVMVAGIAAATLTIDEADGIKAVWEQEYRFRLKFASFADIIG